MYTYYLHAAAAVKSLQSCPTLCDSIDSSPPGSPIPGILQARILEWVAISFSNAWKWKVKVKSLSCVWPSATPWTMRWRSLVCSVHGVAEGQTRLSEFTFPFHFHALEKDMATHSSVLAWRIPGTGEPGGLLSMESHRFGHDWSDLTAAAATI